ncbi:MAG: hypothetical protein KGJ62_09565 [Armatimonadetes bacterium]|nr:hypothetical protein [Armatimonadota bacterium]MDE2205807.1 hypothetical protein [Armatimonadota bacterium]
MTQRITAWILVGFVLSAAVAVQPASAQRGPGRDRQRTGLGIRERIVPRAGGSFGARPLLPPYSAPSGGWNQGFWNGSGMVGGAFPLDPFNPVHNLTDLNSPTLPIYKLNRPGDGLFGGTMPGSLPPPPLAPNSILPGAVGPLPFMPGNAFPGGYRSANDRPGSYLYINGVRGRSGFHTYAGWGNIYFSNGAGYYPYYCNSYLQGVTVLSPYYYSADFPPYLSGQYVLAEPPPYGYIPVPDYSANGSWQGYQQPDVNSYYLNRPQQAEPQQAAPEEAFIRSVAADIEKAWESGDIQYLAKYVRNDGKIAVYLRGQYQYSLPASDYLDMTRDALRSTTTVSFTFNGYQRDQNGVWTLTGSHVYRDHAGTEHTVRVTYVLQRIGQGYYVTQVGSAPDTIPVDPASSSPSGG